MSKSLMIAAVATPGHAANGFNGISMNGQGTQGISMNGLGSNGITRNGLWTNGLGSNGITRNGVYQNGHGFNGRGWNGTAAQSAPADNELLVGITLPDGRTATAR